MAIWSVVYVRGIGERRVVLWIVKVGDGIVLRYHFCWKSNTSGLKLMMTRNVINNNIPELGLNEVDGTGRDTCPLVTRKAYCPCGISLE